ncbi:MAG: hypothetical protein R6U66_03040, partial [Bacteroidales bacterium]
MKVLKNLVFVLLLLAPIAFVSCEDEDDNDPILGEWVFDMTIEINGITTTYLNTWMFGDDGTGTYEESTNGDATLSTTFTWIKQAGMYQVEYADQELADVAVEITELMGQQM